jgi:hypothetical protein
MWATVDGLRALKDAEAELVRRAIGTMIGQLIAEHNDEAQPHRYGIDWYDQWDCDQRIWLLEQVAVALLTDAAPPAPAAMWEATVDAIFLEVIESIAVEADDVSRHVSGTSWRGRVLDAFRCQQGCFPNTESDETDIRRWRIVVTQIADTILGVPAYQKAELFRDGDIQRSRRFLMQKGLPADFLRRIPPLRTIRQTKSSIDRIRSIVDK